MAEKPKQHTQQNNTHGSQQQTGDGQKQFEKRGYKPTSVPVAQDATPKDSGKPGSSSKSKDTSTGSTSFKKKS